MGRFRYVVLLWLARRGWRLLQRRRARRRAEAPATSR